MLFRDTHQIGRLAPAIAAGAISFFLATGSSNAQARMIVGAGTASCRLWNAFEATRDVPQQLTKKQFMLFWVEGYISHVSVSSDRAIFNTRPDIENLTNDYCRDHPDSTVADAADEVGDLLVRNAARPDTR